MTDSYGRRRDGTAGVAALAAGIAWVAWVAINARTHGSLDAGPPTIGENLARIAALLMVAWNVLLLPAAPKLPLSIVWDFWLAYELLRTRTSAAPDIAAQTT